MSLKNNGVSNSSIVTALFEQSVQELLNLNEDASAKHVHQAARDAFIFFLNRNKFDSARALLFYHPVDEHDLLPAMMTVDQYEKSGVLDLTPQTYKIILEKEETAYEKLPCNWQKIHTYLAPLEDGLEQADILDTGNIYITDQRVFFVGEKGSETVKLQDIAHIDLKEDALQFFRDQGLSEIFAFPTAHHAVYAEVIIRHLLEEAN